MTTFAASAPSPGLPDILAQEIVNEWRESILVLDRGMHVTFANQSFCDWVGISWAKVGGRLLDEVLGGPEASAYVREVQRGSTVRNVQVNCAIPSVGNRALLLSGNPLANSKQKAVLLGIVDITSRSLSDGAPSRSVEVARCSEKGQRRQADLLRSIMESSGEGIFVADSEGRCVLSNPACEEILGLNAENLNHLSWEQWSGEFGAFLNDKVTPYPVEDLPLSRALAGESCDNVELWIKNKFRTDGLWISVTARPLTGGQEGAISTFRDVTLQRNAKEELAAHAEEAARSNRELEQFAYVAAHDLQEPLRMVSSYVQLLAQRYRGKLDAEADEFIGYAADGAKRMSALINDLLNYSRIGRGNPIEEVINCEEALELVLHNLRDKHLTAGVVITHDPLPQIRANALQITQVFQNLIDNAVKFRAKADPRVHISARLEEGKWIFSVADNGIGIDAAYKDRVFVIFQRLHSREDYDGTGIGLAVCKKIVEKREGSIWVEPNKGSGTVVYFTWP